MTTFRIKRVYDPPEPDDGHRVLVDRLWPRGERKNEADLGAWPQQIAPSTDLRRYLHDGGDPAEFDRRYRAELADNPQTAAVLDEWLQHQVVTLLTATRGEARHAEVLRALALERQREEPGA